ncbi:hypothetical protein PENTCL1PPCAC_9563 [Pristionchus entomophagus]|uniref:Uncharacterized protein n=1 Tax=Pristionchus entomophagus TaxID=358040 RepID=A0AAV5T3F8_9BILA|nr:hypothetical protein PENTCL1PPCAC_9563 [Pristionchus entomophagus]
MVSMRAVEQMGEYRTRQGAVPPNGNVIICDLASAFCTNYLSLITLTIVTVCSMSFHCTLQTYHWEKIIARFTTDFEKNAATVMAVILTMTQVFFTGFTFTPKEWIFSIPSTLLLIYWTFIFITALCPIEKDVHKTKMNRALSIFCYVLLSVSIPSSFITFFYASTFCPVAVITTAVGFLLLVFAECNVTGFVNGCFRVACVLQLAAAAAIYVAISEAMPDVWIMTCGNILIINSVCLAGLMCGMYQEVREEAIDWLQAYSPNSGFDQFWTHLR